MEQCTVVPEVEAVRRGLERWRTSRPRSNRIPDELWTAAAKLASEHGVGSIARQLRLNHAALKARVQRSRTALVPASCEAAGVGGAAPPAFVEFESLRFVGAPGQAATMTLTAADGATLMVQLGPGQPIDLVALADSFWRRPA